MSLEAAILENTAAIRELIAAMSLRSAGAIAYAEQKALVLEPPAAEPVKPKAKPARNLLPDFDRPVPESTPTTYIQAMPAVEPAAPPVAVTYEDIKVPFLTQLVAKKGRDAGAELLREFGVPDGGKLSDIPEAKWPAVLAAIALRVAS